MTDSEFEATSAFDALNLIEQMQAPAELRRNNALNEIESRCQQIPCLRQPDDPDEPFTVSIKRNDRGATHGTLTINGSMFGMSAGDLFVYNKISKVAMEVAGVAVDL